MFLLTHCTNTQRHCCLQGRLPRHCDLASDTSLCRCDGWRSQPRKLCSLNSERRTHGDCWLVWQKAPVCLTVSRAEPAWRRFETRLQRQCLPEYQQYYCEVHIRFFYLFYNKINDNTHTCIPVLLSTQCIRINYLYATMSTSQTYQNVHKQCQHKSLDVQCVVTSRGWQGMTELKHAAAETKARLLRVVHSVSRLSRREDAVNGVGWMTEMTWLRKKSASQSHIICKIIWLFSA